MALEQNGLPDGWTTLRVDQAGAVRIGRQRSPDKQTGRYSTKYIRAANITPNGLNLTDLLEMDFTPSERSIFALHVGDVLLTEASGSAAQVGRAAIWRGEVKGCCYQNTVIRFRPHLTLPEYALVVFRHYSASGVFARAARGVGIQHLGSSRFAELPLPLPPINEQRRITELTDHRLAEIAEAGARLRSALAYADEQVHEILAAAVAGELVAQEPSSDDGSTINTRPSGQAQVTLFDLAKPVTAVRNQSLGPLPEGWEWVPVIEIGEVTLGRQRSPKHQHGEYMRSYLRVANVFEDRIDTSDILTMNFDPDEFAIYALKYGDILLNEGQSPELVGRPAMYRNEVPGACFQNHLIRFRSGPRVDADFALLVFRHYMHSGVFRGIARWSTNIAHLGLERFRTLQFPLPPLKEQKRIVEEAHRRLGEIAEVQTATQASLDRLPEMERELLAAAVAGELVPQDPTNETAAALVKRFGAPPREVTSTALAEGTDGVTMVPKVNTLSPQSALTDDLASVLRSAGRPLPLPELFSRAGYDRNQPEHVELFYLAIRSELGKTIRQIGDLLENAQLEPIDAA